MSELTDRGEGVRRWRLRAYPEYKESGDEWLGKIPAHWEAKRLRFVVGTTITKSEVTDLDPETEVSFVPMEAVREYGGIDLVSTKPLSAVVDGYTYFRNGDVIVAKITPCFENGKGALATGLCNGVGFGTTELHVLRASFLVDPRFLLYLTFSDHFRSIGTASMYGAGGQRRISDDFIRDFCHPVPGLPEQRAIVAFLDRETAKIDALVVTKERLIELLQEKRTALITRVVTRGLDPNVPMKASGVEWLGEIPAHWEVRQGRYLYRALNLPPEGGDAVVTAYRDGQVTLRANRRAEGYTFAAQEVGYQHVRAGDLVIQGMDAFAGAIGVSDSSGKCSPEYLVLEPLVRNTDNRYFAAALRLMAQRRYILVVCNAVRERAPRFRIPEFRNVLLPKPPEIEQQLICGLIDRDTAKIDKLMVKVQEAIGCLKEFRVRLISAAVTGKIDVREAML